MATSLPPQPAIRTIGAAISRALQDSQLCRVSSPLFGLGLLVTQVAAVLAGSAVHWFGWLCASLCLFGCLIGSRYFAPRVERRWNWFTLAAMGLVLLAGLVKPPHRSNDVYAYGAYGRLVSEHSVSPYATRPSAFPNDPVIFRMASGWQNTRSVYGPVFTAISAAGMRVADTSLLIERLWFQTLAGLATGLSALILKRLSPQYWWMFALNPVVLIAVAHEGHNDALVGLGILSALWFLKSSQPVKGDATQFPWFIHAAIGSLVFAASIKITAILAAPALTMWILRRFGWKRAARIAAPWIAVCVGLFAAIGGPSALSAFRGLRTFRSTTSLWHLDVIRQLTDSAGHKPGSLALTLPAFALAISGLLVILQTLQPVLPQPLTDPLQAQEAQPSCTMHTYDFIRLAFLTVAPLVVFIALGLYVLPWYWAWLLAPAILLPSKLRPVVLICAATHTVAYGAGTQLHGTFATVLKVGRFCTPLAFFVVIGLVVLSLLCPRPFTTNPAALTEHS
jgi:hypothetical protein